MPIPLLRTHTVTILPVQPPLRSQYVFDGPACAAIGAGLRRKQIEPFRRECHSDGFRWHLSPKAQNYQRSGKIRQQAAPNGVAPRRTGVGATLTGVSRCHRSVQSAFCTMQWTRSRPRLGHLTFQDPFRLLGSERFREQKSLGSGAAQFQQGCRR
jgi:hypothetical protein